ncbi:E3 ubiquitin ligase family protein [Haloarcula salinisoli]|uniref:E3 ubiquitin ligase family protein n=1 Tax=Haloarcula salinisoli TaxID=2487746 RepID=A0A8J8CCE4_9EURY|nr:E3 ubiquitin ligase family protein [Halomicroarcula salinisoli]MBX0305338.1 E3 ubiquitin ligase family protein [Halomicroarcula salinisoli]
MANFLVLFGGGFLFIFGLVCVLDGFENWRQARLIEDTPTETVAAAAAGRTELAGVGRTLDTPVDRLLAEEHCLVSRYEIERWDDSDDDGRWHTVARGTVWEPFQVDDGTGTMRVEPDDGTNFVVNDDHRKQRTVGAYEDEPAYLTEYRRAHIGEPVPQSDPPEKRRYTETWIPVGADLYLLGGAEPSDSGDGTTSGLVLRRDATSDSLVVSEKSQTELVEGGKARDIPMLVGGTLASAAGLYFVHDNLAIVIGGFLALAALSHLLFESELAGR